VQACHAIQEAYRVFTLPDVTPNVIVLSADGEDHIKSIQVQLTSQDIDCSVFKEPDIGNQVTALVTEVVYSERRKLFRKYKLLKEDGRE
jgi:hypothetical protein